MITFRTVFEVRKISNLVLRFTTENDGLQHEVAMTCSHLSCSIGSHHVVRERTLELPPNPIKIMSYNIWYLNSEWDTRKHYIADLVKHPEIPSTNIPKIIKEDPDVIGFQEIREKWNVNNSNQLYQLVSEINKSIFNIKLYRQLLFQAIIFSIKKQCHILMNKLKKV